jgi:hypothetical protein
MPHAVNQSLTTPPDDSPVKRPGFVADRRRKYLSDDTIAALDDSAAVEAIYTEQVRERMRVQAEQIEQAVAASNAAGEQRRAAERLSEAECRDALRDAITAYDECKHRFDEAETNLHRAQQRMDEADIQLADYADLDEQITQHHTRQIELDRHDPLPVELADAQIERSKIVDLIQAVHRVHQRLQQDAAQAALALERVAEQVATCATHIVLKHADDVAAELEAVEAQALALRTKLATCAATFLAFPGGTASLLSLSVMARDALVKPAEQAQPDSSYGSTIRDWFQALQQNADAVLPAVE